MRFRDVITSSAHHCLSVCRVSSFSSAAAPSRKKGSESRKREEKRKWRKRGAGCNFKASVYGNNLYSCVLLVSFYHFTCFSHRSPLHSFPFYSSSWDFTICFIYYSDKAVQRADLFVSVQVLKSPLGRKGFLFLE